MSSKRDLQSACHENAMHQEDSAHSSTHREQLNESKYFLTKLSFLKLVL